MISHRALVLNYQEGSVSMAKILKWTNKFSGETGYVLNVRKNDGHFINTYDAAEAKRYARQCDLTRAMNLLAACGECENNYFEAEEV